MKTNGVHYFPHKIDCNFVDLAEAKFGLLGYAIINKLYERIFFEEGYYMNFNDDIGTILASRMGVKKGLVSDLVHLALARNFFNKELYEKYKILTSEDIQLTYLEIVKKRKVLNLEKKFLLASPMQIYKNKVKIEGKPLKNVCNSEQSKQNKTEENFSVFNDIIDNYKEGTADVDNYAEKAFQNEKKIINDLKTQKKIIDLDNAESMSFESFKEKIIATFYNISGLSDKYLSILNSICTAFFFGINLKAKIKLNNKIIDKEIIKFKIEHLSIGNFSKIMNALMFPSTEIKNESIYTLGILNNLVPISDRICYYCGAIDEIFGYVNGEKICETCVRNLKI